MTIPSISVPRFTSGIYSPTELHLATVRTQAAIVWAVADALERDPERDAGLREQLAEELARLGCLAIEAAAALANAGDAAEEEPDQSGVHSLA
jgi:hypothetical protein